MLFVVLNRNELRAVEKSYEILKLLSKLAKRKDRRMYAFEFNAQYALS
jgi:hypothetical protein